MKTKLSISIIAMVVLIGWAKAHEGGVGNGGIAHVCRRPVTGEILTVEMLDIRRGKKEMGLSYAPVFGRAKLEHYLARMNERLLGDRAAYVNITERIEGFFSEGIPTTEIEAGSLFWTGDGEPGEADIGCRFEQVGVFQNGHLYVNLQLLRKMDVLNEAAFYAHEAIYGIAKERFGAIDSVESQRLNALLFADDSTLARIQMQIARIFPGLRPEIGPARYGDQSLLSPIGVHVFANKNPISLVFKLLPQTLPKDCIPSLFIRGANSHLNQTIPLIRFPSRAVLRRAKDYTIQVPLLPSAIFANTDFAQLELQGCYGTQMSVSAWQSGRLIGYWERLSDIYGFRSPVFLLVDQTQSPF